MIQHCSVCFNRDNEFTVAEYEVQIKDTEGNLGRKSGLCSVHLLEFIATFMFWTNKFKEFSARKLK